MRHIEVHENRWLVLHEYRPPFVEVRTLSIVRGYWRRSELYAEDGSLWRPKPVGGHELALITRMLAHTVYSSRRTLSMSYERIGDYSFRTLRTTVKETFRAMFWFQDYLDETLATEGQIGLAADFDEIFRLLRAYPHWAAAW